MCPFEWDFHISCTGVLFRVTGLTEILLNLPVRDDCKSLKIESRNPGWKSHFEPFAQAVHRQRRPRSCPHWTRSRSAWRPRRPLLPRSPDHLGVLRQLQSGRRAEALPRGSVCPPGAPCGSAGGRRGLNGASAGKGPPGRFCSAGAGIGGLQTPVCVGISGAA
jgi:hypothetical protein